MKNKKGNTSLHESLVNHRYDLAIKLLEAAKEVTPTRTALWTMRLSRWTHEVATMHIVDDNEVVTLDTVLLHLSNDDGDTPLFLAVRVGRLEGFERLVKYVTSATNIRKKSSKVSSTPHLTSPI